MKCLFPLVLLLSLLSCSPGTNLEDLQGFRKPATDITALLKNKKLPIQYLDKSAVPIDIMAKGLSPDIQVDTIRTHFFISDVDCQLNYRFDEKGNNNQFSITYDKRTNPKLTNLVMVTSILGMKLDNRLGKPRIETQGSKKIEYWKDEKQSLDISLTSETMDQGQVFESLVYWVVEP